MAELPKDMIFHYHSDDGITIKVDAIPLVRCGECKYHMAETERTNPYCTKYHCMRADDWFCADGEREVQE
jgi:hypothetical protein